MLKQLSRFVAVLLLVLPVASEQQTRVYGDGGNWTQEITGSLATVRNLKVKVDIGSVRVEGGSQQSINYTIRNHSYSDSQDRAQREFDNYKISAYVRGDTALIVADWEGGRPHKFSGDFVVNVPRAMDEIKIETEGGNVSANGITGRLDAESGGGSIHIDDIGGTVNAETGGGSIKVNTAKGRIEAESGGGTISIVSGLQDATLETGGGNIQVQRCVGR